MDKKTLDGFAEALVSEFEEAHSEWLSDTRQEPEAAYRVQKARNDLLQALRVPKEVEGDDFLTPWDYFAAAAVQGLLHRPAVNWIVLAQQAAETADNLMTERARRQGGAQ